jgi:hypothetical protein
MIDLETRRVERTAHLSAEPYSTTMSADGVTERSNAAT